MGLLTDDIRKAYFESGTWRVHLYRKGREISEYEPVDPAWNFVGGNAATARYMWTFGGYTQFDEVVVTRDGVVVDREALGGTVSCVPGQEYWAEAHLSMTEA